MCMCLKFIKLQKYTFSKNCKLSKAFNPYKILELIKKFTLKYLKIMSFYVELKSVF